jgi:hypothetical protein|mmetsp:Transcript_2899/g.5442  ORF Transcript_2899/g.5442 Transcript_2899/m.5442 type:complete len:145 (+) Transcript_2899:1571-2005(+)
MLASPLCPSLHSFALVLVSNSKVNTKQALPHHVQFHPDITPSPQFMLGWFLSFFFVFFSNPLQLCLLIGSQPNDTTAIRTEVQLFGNIYGKGVVLSVGFVLCARHLRMYLFFFSWDCEGPKIFGSGCQVFCALDCAMFVGRRGC